MDNEIRAEAAARDIMATLQKITKPVKDLTEEQRADLARNIGVTILDQFGGTVKVSVCNEPQEERTVKVNVQNK